MTRRTKVRVLVCSLGMFLLGAWSPAAEATTWNIVFEPDFLQPLALVGVGDVDGDGVSDLIWRHPATGETLIALTQPDEMFPLSSITPIHVATIPDLDWEIAGVGDLNGDRREDLVWVNRTTQRIAIWIMKGTAIDHSYLLDSLLPVPPAGHRWKLLAVKDISGNGEADIVWALD